MAKPPDTKALIKALAETTKAVSDAQTKLDGFDGYCKAPKGAEVYETYVMCKKYLKELLGCLVRVMKGQYTLDHMLKSMDKKTKLYTLTLSTLHIATDCYGKLMTAHDKMKKIVEKWLKVLKNVKHK